jgi:hypothetical protein
MSVLWIRGGSDGSMLTRLKNWVQGLGTNRSETTLSMAKKLACRLGRHDWTTRVEEGESYQVCAACGKSPREPGQPGQQRDQSLAGGGDPGIAGGDGGGGNGGS